jgi:hypothetical protein
VMLKLDKNCDAIKIVTNESGYESEGDESA